MNLERPDTNVKLPREPKDEDNTDDNLGFLHAFRTLRESLPYKTSRQIKTALTSALGSPDRAAELLLDCPSPQGPRRDAYSQVSGRSTPSASSSASGSGIVRGWNLDSASPESIASVRREEYELNAIDDFIERERVIQLMTVCQGYTLAQGREALKRSAGNIEEAANALLDSSLAAGGEDFVLYDLGRPVSSSSSIAQSTTTRTIQPTKSKSFSKKETNPSHLSKSKAAALNNDSDSELESSDDDLSDDDLSVNFMTTGFSPRSDMDIEKENETLSDDETLSSHMSLDSNLDQSFDAKAARLHEILPYVDIDDCKIELQLADDNFDEALKALIEEGTRSGVVPPDQPPRILDHLSSKRRTELEGGRPSKTRRLDSKGNSDEQDSESGEAAGQWVR